MFLPQMVLLLSLPVVLPLKFLSLPVVVVLEAVAVEAQEKDREAALAADS
tara:strand:+ start:59 stop:208 length:150 start_codon:yes stop_codon:yes gene_type:complete